MPILDLNPKDYLYNKVNTQELSLPDGISLMYPLPKPDMDLLVNSFTRVEVPAKTLLFKEGEISDKMYYLSKGFLRAYYTQAEQDITLWLGHEGDFVTCYRSWLTRKPGHEYIQLTEDCVLYSISHDELERLTQLNAQVNHFFRKVIEDCFLYWENRGTTLLFQSARERYKELIARYPMVLQRLPLVHIASYLGITPETLSRLRSEK